MAQKIYMTISTLTHYCPKCRTVLKKEKRNDFLFWIYFFLFIPVGLIALIVYLIKKKTQKEEFNNYGEQIICCPTCQSLVAIRTNSGGMCGNSRIVMQEKELLKIMEPIISYLHNNYNIYCDKYDIEEKYSEMLGLCFKNNNVEYNVFIVNFGGEIKMKIANADWELFDMEKLTIKLINTLV